MIEGFSLGNYLILVEYTGRLFREGKAVISSELAGIFERLGCSADHWQTRLQKLAAGGVLGRSFAVSRGRFWEVTQRSERAPRGWAQAGRVGSSRCLEGWIPSLSLLRDCSRNSTTRDQLTEKLARVGQSYRKISKTGLCGGSLAIRF